MFIWWIYLSSSTSFTSLHSLTSINGHWLAPSRGLTLNWLLNKVTIYYAFKFLVISILFKLIIKMCKALLSAYHVASGGWVVLWTHCVVWPTGRDGWPVLKDDNSKLKIELYIPKCNSSIILYILMNSMSPCGLAFDVTTCVFILTM